jgi:hypothetical protein
LKGHDVVLAEASAGLGGTANVAKLAPCMHAFGDITDWLEREIYRLGIQVRTNSYMEKDDVLTEKPDAVIIATGGMPRMDGVQAYVPAEPAKGVEQPHVIDSTTLLTETGRTYGNSALVFDDVGHYEAVAAAEFLIEKGVAVTFATRCNQFAPIVDTWTRAEPALERMQSGDFRLLTRMHLREIRKDSCVVRPLQGVRDEIVPADTVVLVLARESLNSLYEDLRGSVASLSLIGDAKAPRDIQAAIWEGHLAARAID